MRTELGETRTPEQIRRHYEVEKELAAKLRRAGNEERRRLYTEVYDELFRRVPDHPQLAHKNDETLQRAAVKKQIGMLARFLTPETTFLEVGSGDCSLSRRVANVAKRVFAVDVSSEITKNKLLPLEGGGRGGGDRSPTNVEVIISDGVSIDVPAASVELAYSNQLMEHLHPDDALTQLKAVFQALAPRGCYICVTPNRLSGPHDVSKYFDRVPTGFHLKEYTLGELEKVFKDAGFGSVKVLLGVRRFYVSLPAWPFVALEWALCALPSALGRRLARWRLPRFLLGIRLMAAK